MPAITARAPTLRLRQALPAMLLWLVLGCGEAAAPSEITDASTSSVMDEAGLAASPGETGASPDVDAVIPVNPAASANPRDSSAQDSSAPLDASFHAADAGYSPCKIFTPLVDAEVPVFLSGQLATDCSSRSDGGTPTKGPIPPEAINPGGKGMNWALTPDFIAVVNSNGGIAGYVSKYEMFCNVCGGVKPVLDDTLQHVIGYMVPGRGFVPSTADAGT